MFFPPKKNVGFGSEIRLQNQFPRTFCQAKGTSSCGNTMVETFSPSVFCWGPWVYTSVNSNSHGKWTIPSLFVDAIYQENMLIFHGYLSLLVLRSAFDEGHGGFSSLQAKILLKSWPLASSMLVYLAILASAAVVVDQTQNHLDFTNVPGICTYWTTVFQGRKPWYSFWWVASL